MRSMSDGKMTKTPFSVIMERATVLLEIIHTDVCGDIGIPDGPAE